MEHSRQLGCSRQSQQLALVLRPRRRSMELLEREQRRIRMEQVQEQLHIRMGQAQVLRSMVQAVLAGSTGCDDQEVGQRKAEPKPFR